MYYIGLDVGGTTFKAGVVTPEGKILHKDAMPTGIERPYQEIIADMAALCKKVAADAGIDMAEVASIGVGVPGLFDNKTGRIPSIDPLKNPEEAQLPQAGETRHTNTRSRHPDATRIAVYGNPPKAEPRQTIALERPPGSGKTTTASLTARSFKVTEGTITPGSIDILHIRKTIPPSSSQPAVSRKPAVCRTSA